MKHRRRHLHTAVVAAALGLVAVPPAFAQEEPDDAYDDNTIVVSGLREQEKKIDDFVEDLSLVSVHGPMARYEEGEYCPRVLGLSEARNEQIATRMRQVAGAAGMGPAGEECTTSALVIFAEDGALQDAFRKEHPEYFQELTGDAIEFKGEGGPALSWKLIGRIDRNGQAVPTNVNGVQIVNLPIGSSRLQMATRPVIAMAVVLIERSAIAGLTVQQIADHAFMRTVTDTDPQELKGSAAPTILTVMDAPDGAETPLSLTEWDFAYVKGRYASNAWSNGPTQQAKIRGTMRRDLLGIGEED